MFAVFIVLKTAEKKLNINWVNIEVIDEMISAVRFLILSAANADSFINFL